MFGVTAFDQPFAYTGREWDAATGLYHYRARAYDAEMGRFLQEDPIGLQEFDPNPYRYAFNNPVRFSDPSGYTALGETGALQQSVATSGQVANLGIALNCLFASIGASIEAEVDLVTGRTGKASECSNELLVESMKTGGKASIVSTLADGPIPIFNHYAFRLIVIGDNVRRFIVTICESGECETRERIFAPGRK